MKNWCKLCNMSCSMATINGYCQVTACTQMAEPMPICNDENAIMPYETPKVNPKVDGMISVEWMKRWAMKNWVKSKKCEYDIIVSKMIDDWEKENEENEID